MKFTVYATNGVFVETIEVDSENEIADAAWEAGEEWLAENFYWELEEEEEEED